MSVVGGVVSVVGGAVSVVGGVVVGGEVVVGDVGGEVDGGWVAPPPPGAVAGGLEVPPPGGGAVVAPPDGLVVRGRVAGAGRPRKVGRFGGAVGATPVVVGAGAVVVLTAGRVVVMMIRAPVTWVVEGGASVRVVVEPFWAAAMPATSPRNTTALVPPAMRRSTATDQR